MSSDTQDLNFEQSIKELEEIVERMEAGALTLEESLQAFERGIATNRRCQTMLSNAEQRIKILMEDGSSDDTTPSNPPLAGSSS